MSSCGRCVYFTKMKSLSGNSGICETFDCRTNSDYGKNCKKFVTLKYIRLPKQNFEKETYYDRT